MSVMHHLDIREEAARRERIADALRIANKTGRVNVALAARTVTAPSTGLCKACGQPLCDHSDLEFLGIEPPTAVLKERG